MTHALNYIKSKSNWVLVTHADILENHHNSLALKDIQAKFNLDRTPDIKIPKAKHETQSYEVHHNLARSLIANGVLCWTNDATECLDELPKNIQTVNGQIVYSGAISLYQEPHNVIHYRTTLANEQFRNYVGCDADNNLLLHHIQRCVSKNATISSIHNSCKTGRVPEWIRWMGINDLGQSAPISIHRAINDLNWHVLQIRESLMCSQTK